MAIPYNVWLPCVTRQKAWRPDSRWHHWFGLFASLQAAAAGDSEQTDINDSQPTPAVTITVALQSLYVHVYLESAGCAFCEQFYSLLDQVYATGRLQMVRKTMKDFSSNSI